MTTRAFLLAALLGATAGPALAQANCGGIGAGGIWIGGDAAGSDIATAASALDQLALVLAGNNYVSLFTLSAPADVRLEAVGNGAGDPVIELFDDAGMSVTSDDDGGGGTSSRIETSLGAGSYCLALSSFGDAPMTGTVRIGRTEHSPLTEGNAATTLLPPVLGSDGRGGGCGNGATIADGSLDGVLPGMVSVTAPVDQEPGYAFSISQPMTISITAENEAADPILTLTDANGTTLYENDDYDGLNSRIDVTTPLPPGDYCIGLRALSDASAPVTVTVTDYDPAAARIMMFDRGEAAPPLDGSYPVESLGKLAGRVLTDAQMQPGKAKWYAVDVGSGGLLVIEAIASGPGDPVVTLFDDLGRQVGYNDDGPTGLDSFLAVRVLPGTYLVALSDISDDAALMRLVVERYVPAE